jgi:hypothetical protein
MKNSTFRVRICHASRKLITQFVNASEHLTKRQRVYLLGHAHEIGNLKFIARL